MEKTGKAYGFLQWDVPKKELNEEVQASLIATKAPSGLEIMLDTIDEFTALSGLETIKQEQKADGKNYVLTALYKGATNSQAEDHLGQAFTDLYQSPLYKQSDVFKVSTFSEDD
ncbi:MAG TPA: hypothetical protein VJB94_05265 [Candidatus Nanoarchaeia archaeon]|nr:hypothetical protein [Candidatus Nanoarchaeia archaeon]